MNIKLGINGFTNESQVTPNMNAQLIKISLGLKFDAQVFLYFVSLGDITFK